MKNPGTFNLLMRLAQQSRMPENNPNRPTSREPKLLNVHPVLVFTQYKYYQHKM
jgi:hypothetical protein